jgi:hypothetical protein
MSDPGLVTVLPTTPVLRGHLFAHPFLLYSLPKSIARGDHEVIEDHEHRRNP